MGDFPYNNMVFICKFCKHCVVKYRLDIRLIILDIRLIILDIRLIILDIRLIILDIDNQSVT